MPKSTDKKMTKQKEPQVLYTDDTAAEHKTITITGWFSRNGKFYGTDEHTARFDGCTHRTCQCGNIMTKHYTKCDSCIWKLKVERYNAYPYEEWDGKTPLCEFDGDKYFFDASDIDEYLEENEMKPEDLMLVICKPNLARTIDAEIWIDDLPEDGELPKELQAKMDEMNELIKTLPPISYSPSKIRTIYKP